MATWVPAPPAPDPSPIPRTAAFRDRRLYFRDRGPHDIGGGLEWRRLDGGPIRCRHIVDKRQGTNSPE